MCGAPLDVENGQTVATCNFCGSKQTVANADDERKENLFNRANALRINCEFDKAQLAYQSILSIFPTEPEAHWGVTLCKYGIEYVDDPATKKKKPTIHRMSFESILKDSDYLAALANADAIAKEQYQAEAKEIADIQKNILTISQKEEPFDIFICYKETNDQHKRTPDSVMAQEIYTTLTDKGYKVFFSRITLENKLGTMYEPYIFAALNSAKIMLVIGTKKEYFEAVWVKNEWSRFLSLIQTRPDHYLIPCYKDMNAYEMPEEFLSFQAQDLGKLGFMQDLTRGIDKIMGKDTQAVQQETRIIQTDVNVEALLTRAEILIGDKNYEKADELLERVLNNDPKNSQAYLLKLVIELQLTSIDELKNEENTLEGKSNFQKAYDFGSAEQKARLNSINEYIENRNEEARLSRLYDIAMDYKNEGKYTEAEQAFSEIAGFRDATAQAAECVKLDKEGIYKRAVTYKESKNYDDAIATFEKIIDFSDSEKQIAECKELKKSDIYKQALALKEEGKFDEASALFMTILNYNDSNFQVDECERLKTEAQKEAVYASCVIREEINPYFHANQLKQVCKKLATIPGYKDADQLLVKYEGILKDYERELQVKKEEKARARAKKMKKFKWISIFSSIGALIITGVLLLTFLYLVPENRQNKIRSLIDAGRYNEAIALIGENGNYGETNALLKIANAGISFKSGDFNTGIQYMCDANGKVDVEYLLYGGSSEITHETIYDGRKINNKSIKNGYGFEKWTINTYTIDSSIKQAELVLDANYSINSYSLIYNLDGGQLSNQKNTYTIEEEYTIPIPTKKGYTFIGWTTDGINEPVLNYTIKAGTTGDKTFYAHWSANQYTIHLDACGGLSPIDEQIVYYDSNFTLPTPQYSEHTFLGWFTKNNEKIFPGVYNYDDDLYLEAHWDVVSYNITYVLNGGTLPINNPSTYTFYDTDFTLNNPTKTGYSFIGWTKDNYGEPVLEMTVLSGSSGDIEFEACWSPNQYSIIYDAKGGSVSSDYQTVTYDSEFTLLVPTKDYYSFVGWYDDGQIFSNGVYKKTENTYLEAHWEPIEYSISYDLGGGTPGDNAPSSYNVESNTFSISNPSKKGHTFIGWDINGVDSGIDCNVTSGSHDDLFLVAKWNPNKYQITYNPNGGVIESTTQTVVFDQAYDLLNATKDGYYLYGWFDSKDNEFYSGVWNKTENITLYAKWEEDTNKTSITLSAPDGVINGPSNIEIGKQKIKLPVAVPNDSALSFIGWSFENRLITDDKGMMLERWDKELSDATFIAVFAIEIHTIDEFLNIDSNKNYVLMENLDFLNVTVSSFSEYSGIFDGNSHSLLNVSLENTGTPSLGLFTALNNCSIYNLSLDGFVIKGTSSLTEDISIGCLAGNATNAYLYNCSIKNSSAYCITRDSSSSASLFVGSGSVAFAKCNVFGLNKLTGNYDGCFVGTATGNCSFTNCNTTGTVEAVSDFTTTKNDREIGCIGCFVGRCANGNISFLNSTNNTSLISSCIKESSSSLYTTEMGCAGFVGYCTDTSNNQQMLLTFKSCTNNGNINGFSSAAGFVDHIYDYYSGSKISLSFNNCINKGNIVSNEGSASGVVTYAYAYAYSSSAIDVEMFRCANYGNIESADDAAGIFCNASRNTLRIEECCNAGEISVDIKGFADGTGGILGSFNNISPVLLNCCSLGNIKVNYSRNWSYSDTVLVGGLVGGWHQVSPDKDSFLYITNCFSSANINVSVNSSVTNSVIFKVSGVSPAVMYYNLTNTFVTGTFYGSTCSSSFVTAKDGDSSNSFASCTFIDYITGNALTDSNAICPNVDSFTLELFNSLNYDTTIWAYQDGQAKLQFML